MESGAIAPPRADGTFDYDPNGAFDKLAAGGEVEDRFSYVISDGDLTSDGFVVITIGGGDIAPRILSSDAFVASEKQTMVATLSAIDDDGEALTWRNTGGEDAGLFAINDKGALRFKAAPTFATPPSPPPPMRAATASITCAWRLAAGLTSPPRTSPSPSRRSIQPSSARSRI